MAIPDKIKSDKVAESFGNVEGWDTCSRICEHAYRSCACSAGGSTGVENFYSNT